MFSLLRATVLTLPFGSTTVWHAQLFHGFSTSVLILTASSTDIGHKSNIQVHTHDGKPVWTQSFDSVSGPAQVATSNKNFGTIIPYLQPVCVYFDLLPTSSFQFFSSSRWSNTKLANLWNYYNNTPVTAWPLPSPPSPSRSIIFSQDGSKLFYTLNNGDQTKIFWKDVSGNYSSTFWYYSRG